MGVHWHRVQFPFLFIAVRFLNVVANCHGLRRQREIARDKRHLTGIRASGLFARAQGV